MAKSYKVTVFAGAKVVANMAQQVRNATIEASIQIKTVKGGATSATATVLAPGPAGANRKMEDVEGWFVNGTAANPPVATGAPWEAPSGSKNMNWWDGTAKVWSLGSSVPLPKAIDGKDGQGILPLYSEEIAKPGFIGFLKDAQVRDSAGAIFVSLADANTSPLTDVSKWKKVGATVSASFNPTATDQAQGGRQISDRYDNKVNSVSLRNRITFNNTTKILDIGSNFIFVGNKSQAISGSVDFTVLASNYYKVWHDGTNIGISAHGVDTMDKIVLAVVNYVSGVAVGIANFIYSAANLVEIDGYLSSDFTDLNPVYTAISNKELVYSFTGTINVNTTDKTVEVVAGVLIADKTKINIPAKKGISYDDSVDNFQIIYTRRSSTDVSVIKYSSYPSLPTDYIILGIFKTKAGGIDILYSTVNTWTVNGTYFADYYDDKRVTNVVSISTAILFTNDAITIKYTPTEKSLSIKASSLLFIRKNTYKGTTSTFKNTAEQTFSDIPYDYMRLMYDLDNSTYVFKRHSAFTDTELENFIFVGLFYFSSTLIYGYTAGGQSYRLNVNITLKGNGEMYIPTFIYGEAGDSITDSGDTKNANGGYVGEGYGVQVCREFNIAYENHYPKGLNGRTSADYLDQWNANVVSFPDNMDLATIFLGTNDWGKNDLLLGTQSDYLNNTYSSSNRTTYGAFRGLIDKFRAQKCKQIILMTPMQRGTFAYTNAQGLQFTKSAITKNDSSGQWEYVLNQKGFTLKDVVDAIKWIAQYESFPCIDLFNDFIIDKNLLCMELTPSAETIANGKAPVYQDLLSDNLHPTKKGYKKLGARAIEEVRKNFII